jgi:hypothetical protein
MARNNQDDRVERRGGYPSARVPRSEMQPPPPSASQPQSSGTNDGAQPEKSSASE